MLKAEIIIPLTDTAAFPAQREARSPGRVHNPGCRMQQGHHWHLGAEVDEETAQKKLEFEYFQDMKAHFRLLRSVAKSLEKVDAKQLEDLTSFFARELGTEHTLVPDEKATRAHKRARDCTDATNAKRFERWENDIGGDKKGLLTPQLSSQRCVVLQIAHGTDECDLRPLPLQASSCGTSRRRACRCWLNCWRSCAARSHPPSTPSCSQG
jgi:hypothetical protein